MSLYEYTGKSWISPKFWVDGKVLHARTSLLVQVLWLFSYCRRVEVNKRRQRITVTTRWLWFIKTAKEISFARIDYIETKFSSMATSWSMFAGATDQFEKFSIILHLQRPRGRYTLIDFRGEGSVSTGWKGVLIGGDSLIDVRGDQEESFQSYYELLREFTEK